MRHVVLVPAFLLVAAVATAQQGRINAKLSCAKPDVNAMEAAGDAVGHMMMLQKASCTWSSGAAVAGHVMGATTNVVTGEARSGTAMQHGYSSTVYDNGDTTVVRYEGTAHMKEDGSGTLNGKWHFVRGTGALKGITGSGTYKGAGAPDGSASADVMGRYSVSRGKAKGKTK